MVPILFFLPTQLVDDFWKGVLQIPFRAKTQAGGDFPGT